MVQAVAATTTHASSATFLAALAPGAYTETFTQAAPSVATTYSFSGGDFGYTVSSSFGGVYLGGSFVGNYLADAALTVTFTAGNPTAVGW